MKPFLTIKVAVAWVKKRGCVDVCVLLRTTRTSTVRAQIWKDGDDYMCSYPK